MAGSVGTAYVDVAFDDKQVSREVDGLGSKVSGSFGKIAGAIAGAFVLDKVVGQVGKAINAASDLNESVSKSAQVFEQAQGSMVKWSTSSADALGLTQQAALEGAASIGAMLKPMGVAAPRAATMSRTMVQLAADMASFNNQDPSDMLDRIRSGLSGESEPLKQFGTVLSETRVQQYAWATGIAATGKQLTEQQKIQARYGLLLKDTADQQGDFARTSSGLANQQRILSAEWGNAQAQLGKALLPAAIAVTHALVEMIPPVTAAADAVIAKLGPAFGAVVDVVRANWPQVSAIVQQVVAGIQQGIALASSIIDAFAGDSSSSSSRAASAFESLRTVAETVWRAVGAVVEYGRSVIQRVAAGIQAHAAEITATMQAIRAIFDAVWPAIARVVQAAWAVIKVEVDTALKVIGAVIRAVMAVIRGDWSTAWSQLGTAVKALLSGVVTIVKTELTQLAPAVLGLALTVGGKIVAGLGRGLAALAGMLAGELAKIPAALAAAAVGAAAAAARIGQEIVQGVLSGVGGLFGALKSKLEGTLKSVLSSLNPFSPVAHGGEVYIGRPLAEGTIEGWVIGAAELPSKLSQTIRDAVEKARTTVESARGKLSDAWGTLSSDLGRAFDAAWSKPTQAEQTIARLEAQAERARLAADIASARTGLQQAQAGNADTGVVDPAAVVAAQKQLDDALLAQRLYNLRQQAEAERVQRDAQVALQQRHFETALANLQTQLAREGATQGEAQQRILALMRSYGIKYGAVGKELGSAFVTQLKGSLADAVSAAQSVADDVEAALGRIERATAAAKSKAKAPSSSAPAGLVPAAIAPATAAAAAPGPLAAGAAGGTLYGAKSPTQRLADALGKAIAGVQLVAGDRAPVKLDGLAVRVYIGDTELRGIVRHEVDQHDAGVARTLLAGGAA